MNLINVGWLDARLYKKIILDRHDLHDRFASANEGASHKTGTDIR